MPDLFAFGGPQYGLQDGKIARWNGDGTYGTNYDIPSIQMLQSALQSSNAVLEGDDRETATAARVVSAQVTFRFGSIAAEVLSVILGEALQSSGADLESYRFIDVTNYPMPYFGLIGRADAAEGSGDTHLFIPQCKVTEGFTLKLEYNTFSIPEIVCKAVGDDNYLSPSGRPIVMRPIFNAAAQLCTLPPTYPAQ